MMKILQEKAVNQQNMVSHRVYFPRYFGKY